MSGAAPLSHSPVSSLGSAEEEPEARIQVQVVYWEVRAGREMRQGKEAGQCKVCEHSCSCGWLELKCSAGTLGACSEAVLLCYPTRGPRELGIYTPPPAGCCWSCSWVGWRVVQGMLIPSIPSVCVDRQRGLQRPERPSATWTGCGMSGPRAIKWWGMGDTVKTLMASAVFSHFYCMKFHNTNRFGNIFIVTGEITVIWFVNL